MCVWPRRGETGPATEVLTPVAGDLGSAVALSYVTGCLLVAPSHAAVLARGAVDRDALTPAAVATVRAARLL